MPAGTGIAAATLTGAGFSAGTAGAGLSGGTNYTKTVGSYTVQATLYTQPEPGGQALPFTTSTTFSGVLYVIQNGDTSAADAATVAALLNTIGFTAFRTWPNTNVQFQGVNLNGAVVQYSQSF
jgi:hypothetical protein